jgi:hypothetical protein
MPQEGFKRKLTAILSADVNRFRVRRYRFNVPQLGYLSLDGDEFAIIQFNIYFN